MQSDRHMMVIGGTSGIGLATAQMFARSGAKVSVSGRTQAASLAAAQAIGGDAVALDLNAPSAMEEIASGIAPIDGLVITAGTTYFAPVEYDTPEAFSAILQSDVAGSFFALRALAPKLRDGGAIVLTTTVLSERYFFGATALSSARAGISTIMRTFAVELAARGIRVNAVAVGPIDTPAWEKAGATEEDRESVRQTVLLGRLGQAEDVARAIAFLCSDQASFITAAELPVDGGWRFGA
ncbi:MAG: SDR family oxidoreductase [Pseudomonadota bacterium]